MTIKEKYYKTLSESLIKKLELRGMEGYYCESAKDAVSLVNSLIPDGSSISWGGSETIKETGILVSLKKGNYTLYDRADATTPEESRQMYANHVLSDFFLMSSNAVTYDGELINIDGTGNRVACLIHGPKNVIVVVGVNKLVKSLDAALDRASNDAAAPNAIRLNRNTPCKDLGKCADCLVDECMCSHTVITRRSYIKGRIKVIIVGENYGY